MNYTTFFLVFSLLFSASSHAQAMVESHGSGGPSDLIYRNGDGAIQIGNDAEDVFMLGGLVVDGPVRPTAVVFDGNAVIDLKNDKPGRGVNIVDSDGLVVWSTGSVKTCAATESLTQSSVGTFIMINADESTGGTQFCVCVKINTSFAWVNPFNRTSPLGDSTSCPANDLI